MGQELGSKTKYYSKRHRLQPCWLWSYKGFGSSMGTKEEDLFASCSSEADLECELKFLGAPLSGRGELCGGTLVRSNQSCSVLFLPCSPRGSVCLSGKMGVMGGGPLFSSRPQPGWTSLQRVCLPAKCLHSYLANQASPGARERRAGACVAGKGLSWVRSHYSAAGHCVL